MSGGMKPSVFIGDVFQLKDGTCTVIEYNAASNIKVQFEDGTITTGSAQQLRKKTLQNPSKFLRTGDKFKGTYQEWVVLEYIDAFNVIVKCVEDGYTTKTRTSEIRKGNIRNPFYKQVAGVGFIGEGIYSSREHMFCYRKWSGMLHRVYDIKRVCYPQYGGRGVKVTENWHNFQNFAKWFYSQPNHTVSNIEVDKDLVNPDAKLYSESTCTLVPREVNMAVVDSNLPNGLLIGVAKTNNKINIYRARCSVGGKLKNIGVYPTEHQAHLAYIKCKEDYVRSLAEKFKEQITHESYVALKNWSVHA